MLPLGHEKVKETHVCSQATYSSGLHVEKRVDFLAPSEYFICRNYPSQREK